jgi:uncharacterized protein HemX
MTLATPPSGAPEPPAPIIASPITWTQLGVILIIVVPLIGVIYTGIRDGQNETNKRLDSLEATIQRAIPVLANAPKLEDTVSKAHDDVINLQESIKRLAPLPEQVQSIQIQLNNIQKQVHTIPGVRP